MMGVGAIPAESLRHFTCGHTIGGDISRSAVRSAARNHDRRRLDRRFDALRWDVRSLPLRSGSVDKIVTDFPWNNRAKADPSLLRDALAEFDRVLRDEGLAVLLLLRTAAQQIERFPCHFTIVEDVKVVVGGWPVAMLILRKRSPQIPVEMSVEVASHQEETQISACTSAVCVSDRLATLTLSNLLVEVFPSVMPTQSAARRAIRHRRVCLAADPLAQLWWNLKVPNGATLVLRPHCGRHAACDVQLDVIWEDADWLAVLKPPGLAVLHARRSLATALMGLQASRGVEAAVDGPWTPVVENDDRVGGAWLVTKHPAGALAILHGRVSVLLTWHAVLRGLPSASTMSGLGLPARVLRRGRSLRYSAISEVVFTLPEPAPFDWRSALAAAGHPVIGDRPHCDGPAACLWVGAAYPVMRSEAEPEAAESPAAPVWEKVPPLPAPDRFQRLFEREERVCVLADSNSLSSPYCRQFVRLQIGTTTADGGAPPPPTSS